MYLFRYVFLGLCLLVSVCLFEHVPVVWCVYVYVCVFMVPLFIVLSFRVQNIMEHGSTPYVGLTPKKHGCHTLAQILFLSEN